MPRPTDAQRRAFQALARSYRAQLPAKIEAIGKAAAPFEAGKWDVETLTTVYRLAHSLTGSAAIYGFEEIRLIAEGIEKLLSVALEGQAATAARLAEVAPLLQALSRSSRTRAHRRGRGRTPRD
jgi:chemotaxis protein histidine kinase CheA